MILPSKHLIPERSLLGVGAELLKRLDSPQTISHLWHEMRGSSTRLNTLTPTYDWFVLALDFLYVSGAIDLKNGRIVKARS